MRRHRTLTSSQSSTMDRLPPETTDHIFTLVAAALPSSYEDCRNQFLSCIRVCRSWKEIAERHLYAEIYIDFWPQAVLLQRTLCSRADLKTRIKDLTLRVVMNEGGYYLTKSSVFLLMQCTNLRRLALVPGMQCTTLRVSRLLHLRLAIKRLKMLHNSGCVS